MLRQAFWLFCLAILLFVIFLPGYTRMQDLRVKNLDLQQKIKRLEKENALLENEARRIKEDAFYQEKIARERMGVVRKGEVPVKIVPAQ